MQNCVWYVILDAELYATCPGERVLVVNRFNVIFLPLRLCYENTRTQWRLVVKLAGRAARFHIWLNIWDCRPGCFYN